jgi:hypothetical protein
MQLITSPDNQFHDGNPATGALGTPLDAAWFNAVQGELVAPILAAGMQLNPNNNAQLLAAIQELINAGSGDYLLDTGTVNAPVVAANPAIEAYGNGLTVRFRLAYSITGASTLNAGPAVVPLVRDDGSPTQNGDGPAGSILAATYDLPTNKFYINSVVPSQIAAQVMSIIQSVGERYSGVLNVAATSALTTAALGALVNITATGTTQTLPAAASCPQGTSVTLVYMQSKGSATVNPNGTDTLQFGQGNSTNSLTLNPGEGCQCVSNGVNGWVSAGQTLSTGVTPQQFDNSTKLATTAFVQMMLGNFSGSTTLTGTMTLTASAFGNYCAPPNGSAGGFTVTLPAASGNSSRTLTFFNSSSGNITLAAANFNTAYGAAVSSIVLPPGGTVILECDGTSYNGVGGSGASGGAVRPQTATGVGQISLPVVTAGTSGSVVMPAGGTWMYFFANGFGAIGYCGIAAGGATVLTGAQAVAVGTSGGISGLAGFCWRIA